MRKAPVPEIIASVHMRDGRKVAVGLGSAVFGGIATLTNRTANKHLTHPVIASHLCKREGIRIDRYLDPTDIERHRARRCFGVVSLPKIKRVGRSLKQLDYVDGTLRVVSLKRAARRIIAAAFKRRYRVGDNTIHARTISQAFGDSLLGVLILDDQGPARAGIFRLPQNPHLANRARRNEVISQLRRRESGMGPGGRRSSHG